MTKKVPYSFSAKMNDGRTVCQGDKPMMIAANATPREIEQLILERLQDEGDILNVRWHIMSDYNM